MRAAPVNLIGGFYADDSLPWSAQDTVNLLPYAAETVGTRTQFILRDAPGLRPLVRVGDGPIRGQRVVEGKLLVVSGNTLYQVSNSLVSIPRGTIPGTGPVSITHNQRGTTNQVLIVNGAAGYVYDTSALTLTKITDDGYPGAFVADFVDGYLAQIEPRRRYWFHSALRQALDYNTLDRYEAEGQPDALVSLIVDHREVWVFGERSIEPFVNTGAATNTFQRASNTVIEQGCSARFSPAKLDNSVMWLDDLGIVRRAQGYTPVRISTGPIERAIAGNDWSRAVGFTWTDRGHAVYYLTFPDGQTWGYDLVTGVWHRRQSYGLDRWRVSSLVYWNGQWIAGDFQRGLLYVLDWDYPLEGDDPLVRERITGVTHSDQARVIIPYAELVVDTGGRTVEAVEAPEQPDPPVLSGDAPGARIGEAYSYAYSVTEGRAPYVVRLTSGSLPPGLTLSSAGVLSGEPTEQGDYEWTLRATDANGLYDDLSDSASIGGITLLSNLYHYFGRPPDEVAASGLGIPVNDNRLTASPVTLVAASALVDPASTITTRVYDPGTDSWGADTAPTVTGIAGGLAWSPDGTMLAVGTYALSGTTIRVFKRSGTSWIQFALPASPNTSAGTGCVWAPDASRLVVVDGGTGNRISIYQIDADAETITLQSRQNTTIGSGDTVQAADFVPGQPRYLVTGWSAVAGLRVVDMESGANVTFTSSAAAPAAGSCQYLKFYSDTAFYTVHARSGGGDRIFLWTINPTTYAITLVGAAPWQPTEDGGSFSADSTGRYLAFFRNTLNEPNPVVRDTSDWSAVTIPVAAGTGTAFMGAWLV